MPIDTSMYGNLRTNIQPVDPYQGERSRLQRDAARRADEEGKLQLDAEKRAEISRQTVNDTLAKHGGDLGLALPELAGKVDPKIYFGLQNTWVETQKGRLALSEQQGKVADQVHEEIAKLAAGVQKAGNTPEAFMGAVNTLALLNPNAKQHLAQYVAQAQQDPKSIGPMMDQFLAGSKFGQDQQKTQAEIDSAAARTKDAATRQAEFDAKKAGINSENQIKAQDLVAKQTQDAVKQLVNAPDQATYEEMLGEMPQKIARLFPAKFDRNALLKVGMAPDQVVTAEGQAAGRAETGRHNRIEEGQGAARGGIEQKRFDATLGSGLDANGKPLAPDELKARALQNPAAVAIAEYRMLPPAVRNGIVPPVMKDALAVNPAYDATQYNARNKYRIALTSGPQGQALNSLNTAVEHLDQFVDFAKKLGNGSFQPGNEFTNWIKTTFGDSAPTNFEGMKDIMAGELASAFKKSGATDQEIKSVVSAIKGKASTEQLVDYATKVAIPAIGGKIHTYVAQTKATMGEKDPLVGQIVTPGAKAVLQKHSYDPESGHAGGQMPKVSTKADYDALPSGATYIDAQDNKTYKKR